MSSATAPQPSPNSRNAECRAWARLPCDVEANCQPMAARGSGLPGWPGMIQNVSSTGIGLVLGRRFEPGTTLSVELPGTDRRPLLARVVQVQRQPDGRWLLGCTLASRLSEEEVEQMRGQPAEELPAPCEPVSPSSSELFPKVILECCTGGRVVRRKVRWLGPGPWPPPPGTILPVGHNGRVADPAGDRLRVVRCSVRDGRWILQYEFAGQLSPEALRVLGRS